MLNNEITVDPKVIADGFNNVFINIGPTLASKIKNFYARKPAVLILFGAN